MAKSKVVVSKVNNSDKVTKRLVIIVGTVLLIVVLVFVIGFFIHKNSNKKVVSSSNTISTKSKSNVNIPSFTIPNATSNVQSALFSIDYSLQQNQTNLAHEYATLLSQGYISSGFLTTLKNSNYANQVMFCDQSVPNTFTYGTVTLTKNQTIANVSVTEKISSAQVIAKVTMRNVKNQWQVSSVICK